MHKRIALLGIFVTCAAVTSLADDLDAATQRIAEAWRKHKTISAKVNLTSRIEAEGSLSETTAQGTFEHGRRGEKPLVRMELKTKSTNTVAGQTSTSEAPVITIIDGEYAYVITEMDGKQLAQKSLINQQTTGEPEAMISELKKEKQLKLLPAEKLDGRETIVIEATPKQPGAAGMTSREVYWFDVQTGLLTKMAGNGPDGKQIMEMTYTDIKTDVDINPSRFKLPEGVEILDQTRRNTTQPAGR
jgi:outer membrane lipoprotein-sorting protein